MPAGCGRGQYEGEPVRADSPSIHDAPPAWMAITRRIRWRQTGLPPRSHASRARHLLSPPHHGSVTAVSGPPDGRAASSGRVFRNITVTPRDRVDRDRFRALRSGHRVAAYRTPFHSSRSPDRGSSTTSDATSKRMVARRRRSYRGQPGSPLVANATQARVHGVRELLRRSGSPECLGPAAERVEHERDLEGMACSEAPGELRGAPGELVHVGGRRRSSHARRPGAWRGCANTSRSGWPRADRRARPRDVPRDRRPASVRRGARMWSPAPANASEVTWSIAPLVTRNIRCSSVFVPTRTSTPAPAPAAIRSIGRAGRTSPSITGCQGIKLTATS